MSIDIDRLIQQRDYHIARARRAEKLAVVLVGLLMMFVW